MKGPYIPTKYRVSREDIETKLNYAQYSNKPHLIEKYSRMLDALDQQITNRENVYYNREVVC